MALPAELSADESAARYRSAPIAPDIARQAVHWLLTLQSDDAGIAQRARDQHRLQAWLAKDAEHVRAWQRIADVDMQLRGLDTHVAMHTLANPRHARRHAVQLTLLLTGGVAGAMGGLLALDRSGAWMAWTADLSTRTGEQRDTVLPDGTRVTLNTASAVDVRFSATERLLVLRAGEILVETATDTLAATRGTTRPFRVTTAEGTARALGTRFTVRQREGRSDVAVLQGAVELSPGDVPQATVRLKAGMQGYFTRSLGVEEGPLRDADQAWHKGMLVADDMRLGDFLHALSRYRPGLLRCDPDVAELRVSGSYPLANTDRVLAALRLSLPVEVHTRTRWWVTVTRR